MIEEIIWGFESVLPKKREILNPRPPVPETNWKRPTGFPSLKGARVVALDTETYDPDLLDYGPGAFRGVGHLVGVSLATDTGICGYWPMRHTEEGDQNFAPEDVLRWLREELRGPQLKVGHNILYDLMFLHSEGVVVEGPIHDTWTAEKLICHQDEASLEATARRRVGEGKSSEELYRFLHAYYGKGRDPGPDELRKMIAHVRGAPPRLAGPYAESDTLLPLAIYKVQLPILEKLGLLDVFDLENRLLPLLVRMRQQGVSVDMQAAEKADAEFTQSISTLQAEVEHLAGTTVNTGSSAEVGRVFDTLGIAYPRTEKTKVPSIKAEFLETVDHPIAEKIIELELIKKFQSTFIRGFIMDSQKGGKVFPTHNPMKAITGRMSCEKPNTQQIPSRNILAKVVRGIFIPDPGHDHWYSRDYSSVESRVFAHFAVGPGADELREQYNKDPDTDFHKWNQDTVKRVTGIELNRKHIKQVAFSRLFGASDKKQAKLMKITMAEAAPVLEAFTEGLPYIGSTLEHFSRQVQQCGETRTILGRRVGFDAWESMNEYGTLPLPFETAISRYGTRVKRAYTHKATNYTIQGSAADLMKAYLVLAYEGGIFDATSIPRLLIHDSCEWSVPDDSAATRAAFRELKHCMETALPFKVPIRSAAEKGKSWGSLEPTD